MPNAEKRARQLSCLYYNQGLERAAVRDLTGAEVKLRQSLQLNKRNTQARNLLGLVYYETGEIISALQEWLISQSLQSRDNLASEYLVKVQTDQARFKAMKDAVSSYNKALQNCREGNEDIAAIQLRRVVSKNPKMIRASQLLALIDIKDGRLGQAARILRRIEQIDRTNPVTLRYLREIEQLLAASSRGKRVQKAEEEAEAEHEENAAVTGVQKVRFRDTTAFSALMNILIGLAIGILAIGLLIVPAMRKRVNNETNTRIVDYTTTIAEQKDHIENLNTQIQESNAVVEQAREQVESTQVELVSYRGLINAYNYMQDEDWMKAGDEIAKVDATKLSDDTIEIYNMIHGTIEENAYAAYEYAGDVAAYEERWAEAVPYFEKAIEIKLDVDVLNLLARSCVNSNQNDKAIKYYQMLLDNFPDSRRASNAEYEITVLGGTPRLGGEGSDEDEDASDEDTSYTDTADEEAYTETYEEESYGDDQYYSEEEYYQEETGEYAEEMTEG